MATEKRAKRYKQEQDILIYESLKYIAVAMGFKPRSKEAIRKVHQSLGLVIPEVPRTDDLEDKSAFIIEVNRMIVSLYTDFNLETREFSKNGALKIVISVPTEEYNSKRVFVRQFARIPGVDMIVEEYLEYILDEISEENRPLTEKGNWASLLEITQDYFFWVDEEENIIRGFFENAPSGSLVEKNQYEREYYEMVTRKKRKYKKRRREIKKKYATKY